jgi:uncharacterized protein YutE (UPF0331/DUF86 family)
MTSRDVLYQKINSIQNCLKRIHDTVGNDLSRLQNLDVQDIVVLNLQRAIQLVIDMGAYVIAAKQLGIPQSLKDIFLILEKNKFLNHHLSQSLQKMVGFRNIAVHDYQAVDPEILKAVISKHLNDFENFYSEILQNVDSQ